MKANRLKRIQSLPGLSLLMACVAQVGVPAHAHELPVSGFADEIVGGVSVTDRDAIEKSVVALYRQAGTTGMLCSATLIAKDMAVTAAHCVDQGIDGMVVIFGNDIQADAKDAVRVIGSEIQPAWSAAHPNDQDLGDIAVIRFDGELPDGFKPARLAPPKMSISAGETVVLAGYGITNAKSQAGAGVLRKAEVKIINPAFGKTEMILDQRDGSGACHGDSGGPAFITKTSRGKEVTYLVGVTNRSYPDAAPDDCKQQVVYTKVMPYRSWISASEKELRRIR